MIMSPRSVWGFLLLCLLPELGTAQSPNCTKSTQFFKQRVEHGLPSEEMFAQQYQILDDHFKPGGPILYYQQAETSVFGCLVSYRPASWLYQVSYPDVCAGKINTPRMGR